MAINDFDATLGGMDAGTVIVRFASGHLARIDGHNRLALLVALLGQPARISRGPAGYRATWDDAVDAHGRAIEAVIPDTWRDGREIVRLDVTPDAHRAAAAFALVAAFARGRANNVEGR